MSIVTAMRRLRSFTGKKTTPHEQVIELVTEVQRCRAVLEGLGKVDVLYSDRETIAVVTQCLPQASRERWYHRAGFEEADPHQNGQEFVEWLEKERRSAITIRRDAVASSMRRSTMDQPIPRISITSADQSHVSDPIIEYRPGSHHESPITMDRPTSPKVTPTTSSDQGPLSNAFLTQGMGTRRQGIVSQGQHSGERPGYREATTREHALEITEKRRAKL